MQSKLIGRRLFVDGVTRTVYSDGDRQYVIDDNVEKVYGVWVLPEEDRVDTPLVIDFQAPIPPGYDRANRFVE